MLYEFLSAMSIYLSRLHDDNSINTYCIEEMEIMRNNNTYFPLYPPCIDLSREEVKSSDIETRVDLIEDDTRRIEEGDLEHFDTPLFSTGKSYKKITVEKSWLDTIFWKEFLYHSTKYESGRCFFLRILIHEVSSIDRSEVFDESYPWYLRNILE